MTATTLQPPTHIPTALPVHRGEGQLDPACAWRVLDEIDYGMLLVSPGAALLHANHLGRDELARRRFLRVEGGKVGGASAEQSQEIMVGVQSAAKGRRQMLTLRHGDDLLPVVSVPMSRPFEGESASVLLLLGRQTGTSNLAVTFYSRLHGLTPAEESVLKALCDGMDVHEIATAKRVSECTVRTQLRALRDKTGAGSMRLLVQRVAALPPLLPLALVTGSADAQLHKC